MAFWVTILIFRNSRPNGRYASRRSSCTWIVQAVKESVLRAKEKIGDTVAVKIACTWRRRMPFQLVGGHIADLAKTPCAAIRCGLPPKLHTAWWRRQYRNLSIRHSYPYTTSPSLSLPSVLSFGNWGQSPWVLCRIQFDPSAKIRRYPVPAASHVR